MSDGSGRCCGSGGGCQGCAGKSRCGQGGACGGCRNRVIYITEEEKAFLMKLAELPFLPLARFILRSPESGEVSETLEPVYLEDKDEAAQAVKITGDALRALEDKRLITLDYDLPLTNGDYSMYEESAVFQAFCGRAAASGRPELQRGSIALTSLGQDAIDSLE